MAITAERPATNHHYSLDCVFLRRLAALIPVLLPVCASLSTLLFLLLLTLSAVGGIIVMSSPGATVGYLEDHWYFPGPTQLTHLFEDEYLRCIYDLWYTGFILLWWQQCVVYWVGLIPSRYFQVLGDKDLNAFKWLTLHSLGLVVLVALVKSMCQYVGSVLYISWRRVLSDHLHALYFSSTAYYSINVLHTGIDNPDQRITQDVNKLCEKLSAIVPTLFIVPFIIAYYTYTVYINTGYIGVVGIYGFFVVASCLNRLFMSPIVRYVVQQERCEGNFRFQHMQVRVHAESLAFCSPAASTKEQAECSRQLQLLVSAQLKLASRRLLLNCTVSAVDYLGSIGNYLVIAGPIFAGWYSHLTPQQLSQVISKNSFVCMYLIFSFTRLVNLTSDIADIAGITHRIGELMESLTEHNDVTQPSCDVTSAGSDGFDRGAVTPTSNDPLTLDYGKNASDNISQDTDCVLCSSSADNAYDNGNAGTCLDGDNDLDLSCNYTEDACEDLEMSVDDYWSDQCSQHCDHSQDSLSQEHHCVPYHIHRVTVGIPSHPQSTPLIADLCLHVRRDHSLLISGASSCGKTALLRLLRGLWQPQCGTVTRHVQWHSATCSRQRCHVIFVAQRAFFGSGSLLQQVVYPDQTEGGSCVDLARVEHVLSLTRLERVRDQCGGLYGTPPSGNWNDILSPGEMQRLCFARVLYRRPWFAFLDETTSALEPQLACRLYRACVRAGITLISVAHGDLLVPYHRWHLQLNGGGSWRLDQLPHRPLR